MGDRRRLPPGQAEHVLATCPTATVSWYDGVGYVPHLEEPERFNRELAALARGGDGSSWRASIPPERTTRPLLTGGAMDDHRP